MVVLCRIGTVRAIEVLEVEVLDVVLDVMLRLYTRSLGSLARDSRGFDVLRRRVQGTHHATVDQFLLKPIEYLLELLRAPSTRSHGTEVDTGSKDGSPSGGYSQWSFLQVAKQRLNAGPKRCLAHKSGIDPLLVTRLQSAPQLVLSEGLNVQRCARKRQPSGT
eukprot:3451638-Amphidinium_carterae.1